MKSYIQGMITGGVLIFDYHINVLLTIKTMVELTSQSINNV